MNTNEYKVKAPLLPLNVYQAPVEEPRGRSRCRTAGARTDVIAPMPQRVRSLTAPVAPAMHAPACDAPRMGFEVASSPTHFAPKLVHTTVLAPGSKPTPGWERHLLTFGTLDDLPDAAFLPALDAPLRDQLEALAHAQTRRYDYSTMALPLALCRVLRMQHQTTHSHGLFADLLGKPPQESAELLAQQSGGTCFTLAENLVRELKQKFAINAYPIVMDGATNQAASWPNLHQNAVDEFTPIADHMYHVAHTDVAVCHRKGGQKHVLVLPTGQAGLGTVRDTPIKALAKKRQRGLLVQNPHDVAFRALWGRFRMNVRRFETGAIFGIDLVQGVMYMNAVAHRASTDGTMPLRSFHFAGLDPRQPQAESWRTCGLFVRQVQRVFDMPEGFAEDVMFLLSHRDAYLQQVVHPRAQVLQGCYGPYIGAAQAYEELLARLPGRPRADVEALRHGARSLLFHAEEAVGRGESLEAAALYDQASNRVRQASVLMDTIEGKSLPKAIVADRPAADDDHMKQRKPTVAGAESSVGRSTL